MTTAATKAAGARKRAITKEIATRKKVLERWSWYVQDEVLKRAIATMNEQIGRLQTEYYQLGGTPEGLRQQISELLNSG